jgi:cell division septation protein DedD
MKTHTYFLSAKALAVVAGALAASGALVFAVGVCVGLLIQGPVAERAAGDVLRGALPALPALPATASAPIASTDDGSAASATGSPLAWPFSVPASPGPVPAPADTAAAPADTAPAKQKADTTVRRRAVTDVAFVVPAADAPRRLPARDLTPYTVHVGAFRVQRNARLLMARLESAGYKPVEAVRMDGGRELHVVTVGGYLGRRAAILAAERIGDAEHLVASAVPAHAHR